MNKEIKAHIVNALDKGIRFDGRKLDEFREIKIEYGISHNAEGSARVVIGDTEIIAGVKLSIEEPFPDTPDEGALMVGAEFAPMANPKFESGPPSDEAIELARIIDRGIREAKVIDNKKLCIKVGEKVWVVSIDVQMMNASGNLIDASGIAAIAALQDTFFPKLNEDGTIDYKTKTKEKLPIKKIAVPVTVFKVGKNLLIDPNEEEEKIADARLTVSTTKEGTICALQKGGGSPLTFDEIDKMLNLAIEKGKEIRKKLKD